MLLRPFAVMLVLAASQAGAQALSLPAAQRQAERDAPALAAQDAAVRAAREAAIPAGELPDPRLVAGIENVPIEGADRWSLSRDFMTMRRIGVMQDFVAPEKRRLRSERAELEVARESALLDAARVNVRRDAAAAWVEVWLGEQQLVLLRELESEAALGVASAQAALAGGKSPPAESFAARQLAASIVDRTVEARRSIARGRAQLARWLGADATATLAELPDVTRLAHSHRDLLGELERHPHLAVYAPALRIAEADVRLAAAAKRPDWSVEVSYAQRGSSYANMVSIGVRVDLPIFEARRQNPVIASKLAAAEKARAEAEDAKRAHLAEVQVMLADWQAAVERVQRFDATQVPLARERREAALAAYAGGRGDLAPVIEARRNEIETRVARLQALGEAARAWAQVNFLLPAAEAEVHP